MLLTYDAILDLIANFLFYLYGTPSFWFLLNTSVDHGCHLASQSQMSMQKYESLLAAANLAAYTKSRFVMKPKEWGIFLGGHPFRLSECNIDFVTPAALTATTVVSLLSWLLSSSLFASPLSLSPSLSQLLSLLPLLLLLPLPLLSPSLPTPPPLPLLLPLPPPLSLLLLLLPPQLPPPPPPPPLPLPLLPFLPLPF